MNPAQLLAHFDRISEAPDAIPRLRRFILDLAVRGKLVEQDPSDEPAGELLNQIQSEKMRLVKEGDIKKRPELNPVVPEERLFNIPNNWCWVRFGEIADFSAGRTPSRNDTSFWNTGDYHWVSIADLRDGNTVATTKERVSQKAKDQIFCIEPSPIGSMIMSFKLTIGKISRLAVPAFHNEAIISIRPYVKSIDNYLFKVLPKFSKQGETKDAIKGATLNRNSISNILIPLPPLAEQHRIVAKVDELMTLCDQLEAAKAERETQRDRLIAASLHHLNSSADADTSREQARFYLNHLPRLTTRPEHIKQLRQTILNLAVRGRLVSQDPNDEPAGELLKRIQKDKADLIKNGEIRKERLPLPIINNRLPFITPSGWEWTRLGSLTKLVTSGSRDWASYYSDEGAIFLRMGNLSRGSYDLRLDHIQHVKPPCNSEGARTRLEKGDILVSITGEVGLLGLIPPDFGEAYINQHTCVVRIMPNYQNRFFPEFFRSSFAQEQFNAPQRGIKNSFRLTDVTDLLIPLPPLAEQHRIVAKVDELMALCDQLEAQLTTTQADSGRLLEAMLHRALGERI